ncbi:hypothetical protein CMI37_34975 [Candidatus Pacearchaeota archaeon]|nr:hypothetical protein [Candidatus Pacearchaeota archaeon]|tara:strand:- start:1883 stop:2203 length:321 start_codon:yes stop_codon:yes gene_type:complete
MAKSRYEKFSQVRKNSKDYYRLETFPSLQSEELESIPHNIVMWKETDRMDAMAEDLLGDARYWWVICLMNDLVNPFSYSLLPGTLLKIPYEALDVINIVNRKQSAK